MDILFSPYKKRRCVFLFVFVLANVPSNLHFYIYTVIFVIIIYEWVEERTREKEQKKGSSAARFDPNVIFLLRKTKYANEWKSMAL